MGKSSISYLDWLVSTQSFNCRKASPGCDNCYAERISRGMGQTFEGMPKPEDVETLYKRFNGVPKGNVCGIDFMSDFGLATVNHWQGVFEFIRSRKDVQFVFTTKRPERFEAHRHELNWPDNLWMGVSIENGDYNYRADILKRIPAKHRWLSIEPMIGRVDGLDLTLIEWLVTGGESGKYPRHFDPQWAYDIGQQALEIGTVWYHKQGSCERPDTNRALFGHEYNGKPDAFKNQAVVSQPESVQLSLFGDDL
jgi:protein gp37